MSDIQALREILAKEYGINSNSELCKALKEMPEVDMGVFVAPVKREEEPSVYGVSLLAV